MYVVRMLSTIHSTPEHMGKEPWYLTGTKAGVWMGPSSLDKLEKGKIISVKNQNHHPDHPCNDSKSKDSYNRKTVASEVPPILISRRLDQPSFNLEEGGFLLT